jgi:O-antigen ligase
MENQLKKAIGVTFFLYCLAIPTSMAGMEIFSWLTFLLVAVYAFRYPKSLGVSWSDLGEALPWKTMIALSIVVILGVAINAPPESDYLMPIGKMRQWILIGTVTVVLTMYQPRAKWIQLFAVFTSIIAIYAVIQSFTGYDMLRTDGGAVQAFTRSDGKLAWKSAGTYGSPMAYVYAYGMFLFFFGTFGLLLPKGRLKTFCVIATVLVGASVITTYVRGGWIGVVIAALVMGWLVSRRLFLSVTGGAFAIGALGFIFSSSFHARFMTLFDPNMRSNLDRARLWEANWAMFKDYPILGTGYTFNEDLAPIYLAKLGYPGAFSGHAHSNYLQMLAGTGLTGFIVYMILISFFMWLSYKVWKLGNEKNLLTAKVVGLASLTAQIFFHIGGFTECNFKAGTSSHALGFVYALTAATYILMKKNRLAAQFAA